MSTYGADSWDDCAQLLKESAIIDRDLCRSIRIDCEGIEIGPQGGLPSGICAKELNFDHVTVLNDFDLESADVGKVSLRLARLKAMTIKNATIGSILLEDGVVDGVVAIESATVHEISMSHQRVGALEVRGSSHLMKLDLTSSTVESLVFDDLPCDDGVFLTLSARRSTLGFIKLADLLPFYTDMNDSAIGLLDLGAARFIHAWKGGRIARLHHEEGEAGVLRFLDTHSSDATMFDDYERQLRADGEYYEANRARLHALKFGGGWGVIRMLYLDGHGHPLIYVLLLVLVVFFTASVFFVSKDGSMPDCVQSVSEPSSRWVIRMYRRVGWVRVRFDPSSPKADARAPEYHALVMSLATLLPGDALNYLRNFRFVPQGRWQAVGITVLQLFAIVVQGLIVASILLLLGR